MLLSLSRSAYFWKICAFFPLKRSYVEKKMSIFFNKEIISKINAIDKIVNSNWFQKNELKTK